MQFRVIVVTDPPTHPQTHQQTGPITIHCAAASAQCNNDVSVMRLHSTHDVTDYVCAYVLTSATRTCYTVKHTHHTRHTADKLNVYVGIKYGHSIILLCGPPP